MAQDKQTAETQTPSWPDRVAGVLQPGWEIVKTGSSVTITRKEPVTFYNPIALPPPGETRTQMIEDGKYQEKYQITLEIIERLPDEKYQELKAVNERTENELEALESRMRSFMGKGDYRPGTPVEHALYEEYRSALVNLPYHRLPDLYDEKHSLYVRTTRHPWSAFYSAREESECRALLENIYSFAEVYEGKKVMGGFGGRQYERGAVFEAFESRRAYDHYLHKREMNLKEQRGR